MRPTTMVRLSTAGIHLIMDTAGGTVPGMTRTGTTTVGQVRSASTMAADGTTVGVDTMTIGIVPIMHGIPTMVDLGISAEATGIIIVTRAPSSW